MARTELTVNELKSGYAQDLTDISFEAADATNGNKFKASGNEIVLINNTDASSQTISVSSTPDSFQRTGDIDAVSVPAGSYAVTQKFPTQGWMQSDGYIYLDAAASTVELAVLKVRD